MACVKRREARVPIEDEDHFAADENEKRLEYFVGLLRNPWAVYRQHSFYRIEKPLNRFRMLAGHPTPRGIAG